MHGQVERKEGSGDEEHEQRAKRNAVHRGQFDGLLETTSGVAGQHTNQGGEDGVGGEHERGQHNGNDGVEDEGAVVLPTILPGFMTYTSLVRMLVSSML